VTSGAVEGVALGAVETDALGAVPDPPDGNTYVDYMQICDFVSNCCQLQDNAYTSPGPLHLVLNDMICAEVTVLQIQQIKQKQLKKT
jgi:hypothetical protein